MKFENMKKSILIVVSFVLILSSVACSPAVVSAEAEIAEESIAQMSEVSMSEAISVEAVPASKESAVVEMASASDGVLTEAEIEGLLFMREEEKTGR